MTSHDESFRVAAEAYDRYIGRYSAGLARELCALAGVAPGQSAIDVGCGPGGLTRELVARLGAERVAAVDPSPPFAEACRARLPGVRVAVASADALPFGDGEFDCALAQLVLNFLPDAEAGLREMRRVVGPSGTVAAAVWDYAGEMTLLRRFWDAAASLDQAAAALDEGRSMRYCSPDELRELCGDADVQAVVVTAAYDGFEDLWGPLESGVGPAGAYVVSLDDERRAALKQEFRRRLDVADAPFSLSARAWVTVARCSPGAGTSSTRS